MLSTDTQTDTQTHRHSDTQDFSDKPTDWLTHDMHPRLLNSPCVINRPLCQASPGHWVNSIHPIHTHVRLSPVPRTMQLSYSVTLPSSSTATPNHILAYMQPNLRDRTYHLIDDSSRGISVTKFPTILREMPESCGQLSTSPPARNSSGPFASTSPTGHANFAFPVAYCTSLTSLCP